VVQLIGRESETLTARLSLSAGNVIGILNEDKHATLDNSFIRTFADNVEGVQRTVSS
jgi:hypothetical protein